MPGTSRGLQERRNEVNVASEKKPRAITQQMMNMEAVLSDIGQAVDELQGVLSPILLPHIGAAGIEDGEKRPEPTVSGLAEKMTNQYQQALMIRDRLYYLVRNVDL